MESSSKTEVVGSWWTEVRRELMQQLAHLCALPRLLGLPRTRAMLRSEFPLLPIAGGLIHGQLLAWAWYSRCWLLVGIAVLVLLLPLVPKWSAGWGRRFGGLLTVIAGIASMLPLIQLPTVRGFTEESLWVRIEDSIRYPRPGLVEFSVVVIARADELKTSDPDPRTALALSGVRLRCRGIDLPWRNLSTLEPGAGAVIRASVRPLDFYGALTSYDNGLRRAGYGGACKVLYAAVEERGPRPYSMSRLRAALREHVARYLGDGETAGMFMAMALGVRDQISGRSEYVYRATGLAHLLVLSGYQVLVLFYSLLWCGRFIGRLARRPVGLIPAVGAAVITAGFVIFVGLEPSSVRALIALTFGLVARTVDRGRSPLHVFLGSVVLISLLWPGAVLDPGTQLTFSALLGILIGTSCSVRIPILKLLWTTVFTSMCTSLTALYWFGTISLWSIVLNPIVAPLLSILTVQVGIPALLLGRFDGGAVLRQIGWAVEQVTAVLDEVVALLPEPGATLMVLLAGAYGITVFVVTASVIRRGLSRRGVVR